MSAQFLTIPRPQFRTPSISSVEQFALDVREGLSRFPKELPSRYLYDEVGSALFDVITLLPEYGLTRADERLLVLFLGSSIGNFDRAEAAAFLAEIRSHLRSGDALLVGADLQKPIPQLLLAYDDPAGVTAAFNLNLLARINRELGADFDLSSFRHQARWNRVERRIEMHLGSMCRQTVHVPAASLRFMLDEDETIWTESSHKYQAEEIPEMAGRTGFRCDGQWIDREWPFAQNLLIAG